LITFGRLHEQQAENQSISGINQKLTPMIYHAEITIMPLKALLDPQGKAITASMKNLDLPEIDNVRVGKHISLDVKAKDREDAERKVDTACKKLLANPIMEYYTFNLTESAMPA